jgi:hypothetical protein
MTRSSRLTTTLVFSLAAAVSGGLMTSCKREGPLERAGEKLDDTASKLKEKIDPSGPAEKAGKKIDDAVDKATD